MSAFSVNKKKTSILLLTSLALNFCLFSCGQKQSDGFDNKEFDISQNADNSLKVKIHRGDTGYSLYFIGEGKTRDFSTNSKVPWYSIRNKVNDIQFGSTNITYLGNNIFEKINVPYIILPESITSLGSSCVNEKIPLYSYAENVESAMDYSIYYYSENEPTNSLKKYWHLVSGEPEIWIVPEKVNELKKVLFIGNSFTYYSDIPSITQSIGRNLGYQINCESITCGSHTLEQYANENDEYGSQVYNALRNNSDYDYVILQEQSTRSYSNYSSFENGATTLKNLVESTQKNCEIRLYSTWGYESGASAKGWTIPQMEQEIRNKYDQLGKKLNVKVHYVGKAFTKSYISYPDINLYYEDNKHPSYAGAYLSALVHVENLFNCNVKTTSFYGELDQQQAKILQQVAYETYFIN